MTTTEQDKDKGIDEIMNMNIPPEDKVIYIADLAKHRGKMMDDDATTIRTLNEINVDLIAKLHWLHKQLEVRSPWDNFKIWMNGWAKS